MISLHPDRPVWRLECTLMRTSSCSRGLAPWFRRQLADGSLLQFDFEPSRMYA